MEKDIIWARNKTNRVAEINNKMDNKIAISDVGFEDYGYLYVSCIGQSLTMGGYRGYNYRCGNP